MNYSFTNLTQFVSCPRQWMLNRLGFRSLATVPLQFGRYVHECIDQVIKAILRGEQPEFPRVAEAILSRHSLLNNEHVNEAVQMLVSWYMAFNPTAYTEVATELKTVIPIEDGVNITTVRDFRGVMKSNPDMVEVIDWKTGWKNDPEPYTPQVAMYLWPTQQEYPDKMVQGYLWWTRYRKEPKCLMEVEAEDGKEWALGIVRQIKEAEKLPADMGFPATPGAACRLCGVSWACMGGYVPQNISSEEEAKEVAGFALQLDSALAICKEALKRYLKGSTLEVGGEYWASYPKISWKFSDLEAFKKVLEEAGYDPWQFLAVDGYQMNKIRESNLRDTLTAMGERKLGSYFSHRSKPPDEIPTNPE